MTKETILIQLRDRYQSYFESVLFQITSNPAKALTHPCPVTRAYANMILTKTIIDELEGENIDEKA